MTTRAADYVFGGDQNELERLLAQAEDLRPESTWLMDAIDVAPGWRAIDVGCGPIGIMDMLAARVGAAGSVVGLEREARFAAMARGEIARRGLGNVTVVEGDALSAGLEPASFDLVHERLVLINMPPANQQALVAQMAGLTKPGGIVATESWDRVSYLAHPPHPSFDALNDAYRTAVRATNGDGTTGRMLPTLLRQAGLADVRAKVHCRAVEVGDRRRTHRLGILDVAKPRILAAGLMSEVEFETHREALARHLADPDVLLVDQLFVQAWGRKPA